MKTIVTAFLSLIIITHVQGQSHSEEIQKFQNDLNEEFLSSDESPLPKKDREKFTGHNFFPISESFRVEAKFTKIENPEIFKMKTSTDRLPTYKRFGVAEFQLAGEQYQLIVYQSDPIMDSEEYKDYLFLPFTDLTNGEETYDGGRYIDLTIPDGDVIIIDFNKAYHPLCAYNYRYSCPIPPAENDLKVRIEAGVKNLKL